MTETIAHITVPAHLDPRVVKVANRAGPLGMQLVLRFPNDFGASIICPAGRFEVAVLWFDGDVWHITYDTPITHDVVGGLTASEVEALLARIAALPAA